LLACQWHFEKEAAAQFTALLDYALLDAFTATAARCSSILLWWRGRGFQKMLVNCVHDNVSAMRMHMHSGCNKGPRPSQSTAKWVR